MVWKVKPLGEVISKTTTVDPRKSPDQKFHYVDVSGVSNVKLEITEATELMGRNAPSRARRVISEGDVIFATVRPTLKRIAVVPSHLDGEVCSTGYFVFQTNDEIYNRYLFYFLQSNIFMSEMERLQSGASYPAVNDSQVKETLISYPTIEEQKLIVSILDQAFAEIDKARVLTEKNLLNARELFDSYLEKIFSQPPSDWCETVLGEITEVSSGGTPTKSNEEFWNGSIPWYSSGELNEILTTDSNEKITDQGLRKSNAKLFPKGSLLIGMYDTAALKMSILDREAAFNQAISGVRPNKSVNLEFVLHTINFLKPELLKQRRGVRQKNLNLSKIKAISIMLPSRKKQDEIVNQITEFKDYSDKVSRIYSIKINELMELKKSILQKAFSGELTKVKGRAA